MITDFVQRKTLLLVLVPLLPLLSFSLSRHLAPDLGARSPVHPRDQDTAAWDMPAVSDGKERQEAYNFLRTWRTTEAPQAGRAPAAGWHFYGVVEQAGARMALIELDGKQARLREGENLPDGWRIGQIKPDALLLRQEDQSRILPLFGQQRPEQAQTPQPAARERKKNTPPRKKDKQDKP